MSLRGSRDNCRTFFCKSDFTFKKCCYFALTIPTVTGGTVKNTTYKIKALLHALYLTNWNLAVSIIRQLQSNGDDLVFYATMTYCTFLLCGMVCKSWGFRRCSFLTDEPDKASISGTSDKVKFHVFLLYRHLSKLTKTILSDLGFAENNFLPL